tara:strand:- start:6884 stop:7606 length:723 start_codon:yes stop_codon:yes gene_type:complete
MNHPPDNITPAQVSRATEAYNLYLAHRKDAERAFLLMGYDILGFMEGECWKHLGFPDPESFFESPIECGGCGLSSARLAWQYAQVYRRYKVELGLADNALLDVGVTKLTTMIPYVNQDNAYEMLEQGKMQSDRDLRHVLQGKKDPPVQPTAARNNGQPLPVRPIRIWEYQHAPEEFKNMFPQGGDWVMHVPPEVQNASLPFLVGEYPHIPLQDHSALLLIGGPDGIPVEADAVTESQVEA